MEIKLMINGEEKIFRNEFVSAKMLRKSFRIIDIMDELGDSSTIDGETFDKINNYFVELYKNQFTAEEFEEGLAAKEYVITVGDHIGEIVGVLGDDSKN